jgi:hypothetical protein
MKVRTDGDSAVPFHLYGKELFLFMMDLFLPDYYYPFSRLSKAHTLSRACM